MMLVAAGLCLAGHAGALELREIELTGDRAKGRLTLEFDHPPAFDLFILDEPRRLVVDLDTADLAFGTEASEASGTVFGENELVLGFREGRFGHNAFRLVFDLAGPVEITDVAFSPETNRLTLELRETTPAGFAERAGWPEKARWRERPVVPAPTGRDLVVVVDPGHGGIDPGAAAHGLVEKTLVLEISKTVAARIDAAEGFSAVLTREDDRFLPLRERLRIAREARANVFLSFHADTLEEGGARGMSIYTLSERASDAGAALFAERENRADVLSGAELKGDADDVTRLLVDLARRGTDRESARLGDELLASYGALFDLLRSRPLRQAGFFVLRAPDTPSALIELGFLSSETDRARLQDPAFASMVAEATLRALEAWRAGADPAYAAPRRP